MPDLDHAKPSRQAAANAFEPREAEGVGGFDDPAALQRKIDEGLADIGAGRVRSYDRARVVERGRKRLADRSPSA